MDSIKVVRGRGRGFEQGWPISFLSVLSTVHPNPSSRREKVPNSYIAWMVLASVSLSTAHPFTHATSSPVDSRHVKSVTWLPLMWIKFILGKVEEKHLATLPISHLGQLKSETSNQRGHRSKYLPFLQKCCLSKTASIHHANGNNLLKTCNICCMSSRPLSFLISS